MAERTDAHSGTTHTNDTAYKTQHQGKKLEQNGKENTIIMLRGRHADTC